MSDCSPGQTLVVGQFCSFALGTRILLGGEHRTDTVTTYRFATRAPFREHFEHLSDDNRIELGSVKIGNDVWVGSNAIIMSGVTIGDGAVIGAGSVVRRDVPPFGVVAGNPARVARHRLPDDQSQALLRICWWDWPLDKIMEEIPLLLSTDLEEFIARHDTSAVQPPGS